MPFYNTTDIKEFKIANHIIIIPAYVIMSLSFLALNSFFIEGEMA